MHEEKFEWGEEVVRKSDREEFGEVRHWRKRAKPIIDQPTMNGSL
jgi:hypothetical protein